VVDDSDNTEGQKYINTRTSANDSDPSDSEGSESDDDEEPASDNDIGICDEDMDTDWLEDATDYHNIKVSFEELVESLKQKL
jgi:hypothetical protein